MAITPERFQIPGYGSAQPTQIVSAGDGPTTIVNNDIANAVYFDSNSGVNPTKTTTAFLPAQASTSVDGKEDVFAICLPGQTADFLVFPGIVPWNNPVGVQIALNALGLAKESTQQLVKNNTAATVTTLGTPAQDPTVAGVTSAVNAPAYNPPNSTNVTTDLPNNISNTGVPLLSHSVIPTGGNPGNQTFTAGQTRVYGPMSNNRTAYEIGVSIGPCNVAETEPYYILNLTWTDSTSGLVTSSQNWYLGGPPNGSAANQYIGVGPARGDTLTVTAKWNGTNTSGTIRIIVTNTSRIYVRDDFRSVGTFNGLAGVTSATFDLDGGVVLATNPSIAAGATITRSMPLYCGTIRISAIAQSSTGSLSILTLGQSDAKSLALSNILFQSIASAGNLNIQWSLPRGICLLQITNTGAASQGISAVITVDEQEP